MKPTIKIDNVSMYYHDKNNVNIGISKISLTFYKGEFVAVTGESGSGKTSLLNVIGATLPYHEGEIYYDGEPSSHFDDEDRETFRRERIGYICQNYNLIDSYTLLQNVMASMIISGWSKKEAKVKALEYLDKVGLKPYANKKASKISSGQKQRLGIARALAKETDIILADEPTGNLDSENGRQIFEILKELAKDHLVIMVTHNIDEALPYVSRVIRISDGHVVLDETKEEVELKDANKPESSKVEYNKVAWSFANFNRAAKPRRSILLALFLLIVSVAIFVFMGNIIVNMDDTTTKIYDNSAFFNSSMRRLVVMKDDESAFEDEDIEKLKSLKYVTDVDKYDLVNDYNYYLPTDYYWHYSPKYYYDAEGNQLESPIEEHKDPMWITNNNYMRSVSCIRSEDIIEGVIPTGLKEIAVYEGTYKIGDKLQTEFAERNSWTNTDVYIEYELEVTCILKPNKFIDKTQVYFSEKLCKELIKNRNMDAITALQYRKFDYGKATKRSVYIFTDTYLAGDEIAIAHDFFIEGYREELTNGVELKINDIVAKLNVADYELQANLSFVKISDSYFDFYFGDTTSNQVSVYIEDYAYTDEVLASINNLDYQAFSSFRVSSTEYDQKILNARNVTIAVCSGSIIIIFLLTLFVLSAFLSLNQNDYLLLRFIGMNKKTMYWTNFFEMLPTTFVMYLIALAVTIVGSKLEIPFIHDIVKYMKWYQFILIFFVIVLIVWATTTRFNHKLQKKSIDFGGDNL